VSALEAVAYHDGGTALTGRLARPADAPRAAVLVLPTIANITAYAEHRARLLAGLGYLAFVADFYGFNPEGETTQSAANKLRASVAGYRARVRAAFAAMIALPEAHGLARAAIGYCMGGQAALELARDGADIAAAVSFHGLLTTGEPAKPGAIKARLLVCHGDADPLVPRSDVVGFWEEMDAARAHWHFHAYSGVKHGFTDPGSDARGLPAIAYNRSADRVSWAAMTGLFDEVFG
jgi:dienelactone hydrolase